MKKPNLEGTGLTESDIIQMCMSWPFAGLVFSDTDYERWCSCSGAGEQICSMDNLRKAEMTARKGKRNQYGVRVFDRNKEENLSKLHKTLLTRTYRTSPYRVFKVRDPKEREVYALPYFPDRIVHHFKIEDSKFPKPGKEKCLHLQVAIGEIKYVSFTPTLTLIRQIEQIDRKEFPITTKIIRAGKRLEFS